MKFLLAKSFVVDYWLDLSLVVEVVVVERLGARVGVERRLVVVVSIEVEIERMGCENGIERQRLVVVVRLVVFGRD